MKYPKGEELKAAWKAAKSIEHWYMTHKGKPWTLEWVDTKMEAYGDWYLYIDPETGLYYEAYHSIGD